DAEFVDHRGLSVSIRCIRVIHLRSTAPTTQPAAARAAYSRLRALLSIHYATATCVDRNSGGWRDSQQLFFLDKIPTQLLGIAAAGTAADGLVAVLSRLSTACDGGGSRIADAAARRASGNPRRHLSELGRQIDLN